jgi:hypothetical protein
MSSNLWTNVEDLGSAYADSDYAYDAVKTASYLLWAMSGRKYSGTTTVTERYVSIFDPYLRAGASVLTYSPILVDGDVQNLRLGGSGLYGDDDYLGDGTSSNTRIRLRGRKVVKIHTVRDIDGNIIDPSQYYLVEHSTLLATPGATWTPSNVEVTYTYGTPPPTAGKNAARMLAIELVKLYEGDDTCALPQRVTSISRQGISYTVLDNQDFIDDLRTGLYAVDLFLKTSNPDKARARARVFSPDVPKARRITPKPFLYTETAFDLRVLPTGGSVVLYLDEVSGDFLLNDNAWVVSMTVSDYTGSKTETFTGAAVLNRGTEKITITVNYSDILAVLGPREPGVYDIYCTRPSLANPAVDEVINLLTANASIQLGTRVEPIYTL